MAQRVFKYMRDGRKWIVTAEGMETIVLDTALIPDSLREDIFMHGAKQLAGDAAANEDGIADKREGIASKFAQLVAGHFRAERESAGPKSGKTVRALFRVAAAHVKWFRKFAGLDSGTEITLEAVRNWHAAQSDEMRKTISGSKEVKSELAVMAAEEAATSGTSLMS